jgi:hypothetical protein
VALNQNSTRTPGGLGYAEEVLLPVLQWQGCGVFSLPDDGDGSGSVSSETDGAGLGAGRGAEPQTGSSGGNGGGSSNAGGLFGQSPHRASLLSSPSPARLDSMVPPLVSPPPSPNLLQPPSPSPGHSHSRRAATPSSLKAVVSENEQLSFVRELVVGETGGNACELDRWLSAIVIAAAGDMTSGGSLQEASGSANTDGGGGGGSGSSSSSSSSGGGASADFNSSEMSSAAGAAANGSRGSTPSPLGMRSISPPTSPDLDMNSMNSPRLSPAADAALSRATRAVVGVLLWCNGHAGEAITHARIVAGGRPFGSGGRGAAASSEEYRRSEPSANLLSIWRTAHEIRRMLTRKYERALVTNGASSHAAVAPNSASPTPAPPAGADALAQLEAVCVRVVRNCAFLLDVVPSHQFALLSCESEGGLMQRMRRWSRSNPSSNWRLLCQALTTLRQSELPSNQQDGRLNGLQTMPVMNNAPVVGAGGGSAATNETMGTSQRGRPRSGPHKGDKQQGGPLGLWELASLVQAPLPLARLQQVMLVRKRRAEIRTVGLQVATHMLSAVSFPLVRAQIVRRLHGAPWPTQMLWSDPSTTSTKSAAAGRPDGGNGTAAKDVPGGKSAGSASVGESGGASGGLFGVLDSGLQVHSISADCSPCSFSSFHCASQVRVRGQGRGSHYMQGLGGCGPIVAGEVCAASCR